MRCKSCKANYSFFVLPLKLKTLASEVSQHTYSMKTCIYIYTVMLRRMGNLFGYLLTVVYISLMVKTLCSKLGLPFRKRGRRVEAMNSLTGKTDVNEEYREAFRTKSYTDMWKKVQRQLEISINIDDQVHSSPSSSSPSTHDDIHLFENLLELRPETLISISEDSDSHQYLDNYFKSIVEASRICESLLKKVHQVRVNHLSINNVVRLRNTAPDVSSWTHNEYHSVYNNFVAFDKHTNPFSSTSSQKYHQLHDSHMLLLRELTSECRKTKRKTKFIRYIKRALATFLGLGSGTFIILLLLAMHITIGGVVLVPGLVVSTLGIFIFKKLRRTKQKLETSHLEGEQLDGAAKGVYTMINAFDTISRLIGDLKDEMERRKILVDNCVKKWTNGRVIKVVNQFQMEESSFVGLLEEVEQEIHLCFLNIIRSRRLVGKNITML